MTDLDRHAAARVLLSQGVPEELAEDLWKAAAFQLMPPLLRTALKAGNAPLRMGLLDGSLIRFDEARLTDTPGWISVTATEIEWANGRGYSSGPFTVDVRLSTLSWIKDC